MAHPQSPKLMRTVWHTYFKDMNLINLCHGTYRDKPYITYYLFGFVYLG